MRGRYPFAAAAVFVVCFSLTVASQDAVDLGVVDRIKSEAFGQSQVMDHLRALTDVNGPRLTGSPQFEAAAQWTTDRLTALGLSNVHLERWPFGRRWSIEQFSAELVAPQYARLEAMPLAWTRSTDGPIAADAVRAPLDADFVRGPRRMEEDFQA
jgi:hypothetical protein